MRRTVVAALLLVFVPIIAQAMDGHFVQANMIKWEAGPPGLPPGGQAAVLLGNPGQAGPYVVRFKAPAGYKIPAHSHSTDESITVLSGSFHLGHGPKLDTTKGEKLLAGGFVNVSKGMQHYVWFSEPSEIQVHGVGPFDITYVNPDDDPSKTTTSAPKPK